MASGPLQHLQHPLVPVTAVEDTLDDVESTLDALLAETSALHLQFCGS